PGWCALLPGDSMRIFSSLFCALSITAVLSGCASGSSPAPAKTSLAGLIHAEQGTLSKGAVLEARNWRLAVEDVFYSENQGTYSTATICARETAGMTCKGLYRFRWFEASGYEAVSGRTAWQEFCLPPGGRFTFVAISPVKHAKRYAFELSPGE
ncbi:MAG: DUF1425 domain-containing protein, partial [Planctomycetota bacterium]|nr:DUF1425 domain-containing protein [Planctomycetota bacterium]